MPAPPVTIDLLSSRCSKSFQVEPATTKPTVFAPLPHRAPGRSRGKRGGGQKQRPVSVTLDGIYLTERSITSNFILTPCAGRGPGRRTRPRRTTDTDRTERQDPMREKSNGLLRRLVVGLLCVGLVGAIDSGAQEVPKVKIPEPGVPQIMSMEGRYIRVAYNNEGYVILGYRVANLSVGQEWMLLELGFALRDGVPDYVMKRDAISLETPDGKTIPMPTIAEYRGAPVAPLQARA